MTLICQFPPNYSEASFADPLIRFLSLYVLYVHSFILSKSSNPPENIPVPATRCLHLRVNSDDVVVCSCSLYFHGSLLLSNLKRQQGEAVAAANSAGDVHAFHVLE